MADLQGPKDKWQHYRRWPRDSLIDTPGKDVPRTFLHIWQFVHICSSAKICICASTREIVLRLFVLCKYVSKRFYSNAKTLLQLSWSMWKSWNDENLSSNFKLKAVFYDMIWTYSTLIMQNWRAKRKFLTVNNDSANRSDCLVWKAAIVWAWLICL